MCVCAFTEYNLSYSSNNNNNNNNNNSSSSSSSSSSKTDSVWIGFLIYS